MAKTDRAAFAGVLGNAEGAMERLFRKLANDIGNLVLRAAGPEGTVPVERLPELQRQTAQLVDAVFLGAGGKPYADDNQPQAPFPQIVTEGQMSMVDLAQERTAKLLDQYMPEEERARMAARSVVV